MRRGKYNILIRKRKTSNERLSKTKQTDHMPFLSSSLPTWVSDSSDEKLDDDNEYKEFQPQKPIAKKLVRTVGELALNKDFFSK